MSDSVPASSSTPSISSEVRAAMSYSSVMSPITSSTRSSMVMMPAVPPYSSMTTAIYARVRRRSSSTRSAARLSGTYNASRINSDSLNGALGSRSHRSLARNTPTMSSSVSRYTGYREYRSVRNTCSTSSDVESISIATTSVLGRITSWARFCLKSKTPASIARSDSLSSPCACECITSVRSSSGECAGTSFSTTACIPNARATRLAMALTIITNGVRIWPMSRTTGTAYLRAVSGCSLAIARGTSSPTTIWRRTASANQAAPPTTPRPTALSELPIRAAVVGAARPSSSSTGILSAASAAAKIALTTTSATIQINLVARAPAQPWSCKSVGIPFLNLPARRAIRPPTVIERSSDLSTRRIDCHEYSADSSAPGPLTQWHPEINAR
jgi:hypothetical protein